MTTTDREQKRQRFPHAFPHSGRIERALAVEGNRAPFCFIHESRDPDLTECTLVVARLGREIEDQFGIDSEVIFLFSPYQHLQHRLLDALITRGPAEIIEGQVEALTGVRYTPDWFLTFIVCPDEEASEKIREWNESGKTSLAIPVAATSGAGGEIRQGLVREIANVLEERDLYNLYRGRNPVTGSAFFGRTDLLRRISGSIRDGRSLGLFGLRRSGKTSVIREYQRRRREGSEIVVLSDLEAMQELHEFPHHIGEDLNEALREQRLLGKPAYVGSESTQYVETSADLSRRIKQLVVCRGFGDVVACGERPRACTESPVSNRSIISPTDH